MADPKTAPQTGSAPVPGLQLDDQLHGAGGIPLLLLHGGLFNLELQVGQLLPGFGGDSPGHRGRRLGCSVGGAVALHLVIRRPVLVGRLVVSWVSFHPEGDRPLCGQAREAVTVEPSPGRPWTRTTGPSRLVPAAAGAPGQARAARQELDRLAEADIWGMAAPRLLTVADGDAVWLEHMVWFLRLGGGEA